MFISEAIHFSVILCYLDKRPKERRTAVESKSRDDEESDLCIVRMPFMSISMQVHVCRIGFFAVSIVHPWKKMGESDGKCWWVEMVNATQTDHHSECFCHHCCMHTLDVASSKPFYRTQRVRREKKQTNTHTSSSHFISSQDATNVWAKILCECMQKGVLSLLHSHCIASGIYKQGFIVRKNIIFSKSKYTLMHIACDVNLFFCWSSVLLETSWIKTI